MSVDLIVRLREELGTAEGARAANQLLNALFDAPQAVTFAPRVGRSGSVAGIECVIDDDCMVWIHVEGMGYDLAPGETGAWWTTVAVYLRNGRSLLLAIVVAAAWARCGSTLVIEVSGPRFGGHSPCTVSAALHDHGHGHGGCHPSGVAV